MPNFDDCNDLIDFDLDLSDMLLDDNKDPDLALYPMCFDVLAVQSFGAVGEEEQWLIDSGCSVHVASSVLY